MRVTCHPRCSALAAADIAAAAAAGTALSVGQEREAGSLLFEVEVDTPPAARKSKCGRPAAAWWS
jgi:hypothetical protein